MFNVVEKEVTVRTVNTANNMLRNKKGEIEMKLSRKAWIELAEYSLKTLKHSAHNMEERQSIDEFLEDVAVLLDVALGQCNT